MSDDHHSDADAARDDATLIAGPALVLRLVAEADGTIDDKETSCARDFIERYAATGKSHTVRALFAHCLQTFDVLTDEALNDDLDERLAALRESCDWLLHGRARMAYVKVLMELGQHIAEASGGFLGFGDKVCSAERQALDKLRAALV